MKMRWKSWLTAAAIMATGAPAQARHRTHGDADREASFAYYLLSLSYAPDFCAQSRGFKDPRECGVGRHVGFVVHGLWPQGSSGRGPEHCDSASRVPADVVERTLPYVPSESLIQHEWTAHGTCSGLSPADYFAAARQARDAVKIPAALLPAVETELRPAEILNALAAANPDIPKEALRISCYPDRTLQEVRVCLTRDGLSPRVCGPSAGYCSSSRVVLRPVR